jgi:hypothetical protein
MRAVTRLASHLFWQPCLHVCAWLSHAVRQGVLNVTGQTRLQDAFVFSQLAKHASEAASASRILLKPAALALVAPVATRKRKTAGPSAILI